MAKSKNSVFTQTSLKLARPPLSCFPVLTIQEKAQLRHDGMTQLLRSILDVRSSQTATHMQMFVPSWFEIISLSPVWRWRVIKSLIYVQWLTTFIHFIIYAEKPQVIAKQVITCQCLCQIFACLLPECFDVVELSQVLPGTFSPKMFS